MKSSRGIQEHQVWAAADLLIAAGERPTIEKVRQKLGSGSPNTVSPMLDSWFKTLPGRLGMKVPTEEEAGYRMPAEVVAGVKALWDSARKEASNLARDVVAAQRRQLDHRAEALVIAEDELRRKQAAFADLQASLEAALLKANDAINGLERQIDGARQRQGVLEAQAEQARGRLAEAQSGQQRLREEHAAAIAARDQAERQRAVRQDAQEKRLLLELDRAREEAKRAIGRAAKEATRASAIEHRLIEDRKNAAAELRVAEQEALGQARQMMEVEAMLASALAEIKWKDERIRELEEGVPTMRTGRAIGRKTKERLEGARRVRLRRG